MGIFRQKLKDAEKALDKGDLNKARTVIFEHLRSDVHIEEDGHISNLQRILKNYETTLGNALTHTDENYAGENGSTPGTDLDKAKDEIEKAIEYYNAFVENVSSLLKEGKIKLE